MNYEVRTNFNITSRLITVLWLLEEDDGRLRIDMQEDFYHPDVRKLTNTTAKSGDFSYLFHKGVHGLGDTAS
jgi:hypothetical protein